MTDTARMAIDKTISLRDRNIALRQLQRYQTVQSGYVACRYCGSWVVFPDPVAPVNTVTLFSAITRIISAFAACIGNPGSVRVGAVRPLRRFFGFKRPEVSLGAVRLGSFDFVVGI